MKLSQPQSRLRSLDVFRGITIASMILVNSPGLREESFAFLRHAEWLGWTFADTIFPSFLWIIGVALVFSSAARLDRGDSRATLLRQAVQRSVLLYLIGIVLDAIVFPVGTFPFIHVHAYLQLTGVLQKIAVCYLTATVIVLWGGWRGVLAGIVGLNLVYLGLMFMYPVPDCGAGPWAVECNFAGYVDRLLLTGHMARNAGLQDPDGIGALLPAISSVLFGVLAGYLLRRDPDHRARLRHLLVMAAVLLVAGLVLSAWIPVSKPLWTTSYAVLMAGLSSACMAFSYWAIDVRQWVRAFKPLEIFGMNAIAAYIVSMVGVNVPQVHIFGPNLYEVYLKVASPANASLAYAATILLAVYVVVWLMYRRRWFLRL
jgi:predicted acyltransferase